jgi:hypothetical protein
MNLTLATQSTQNRRFVLLSPVTVPLGGAFQQAEPDDDWRDRLLLEMQRLRGRVYLEDGAVSEDDLTIDGRHFDAADDRAWHLLILTPEDRVVGCLRYMLYPASTPFNRLRVSSAALARTEQWSTFLRCAVEKEIETARQSRFSYVEIGGWALDQSVRGSSDALRSALFTYAWCQAVGGCIALSMATHRNGSASILRRIGGRPLEWNGQLLPSYYDPRYRCEMEVVRFDSRVPSPKYRRAVDEIRAQIPSMPIIRAEKPATAWDHFLDRLQHSAADLVSWSAEGVAPSA